MFKNLFVGLRRFEDTIQTDPHCFPPRHGGCPPLGPHFCVPMARSPPAHWPAQMEAVLPVGLRTPPWVQGPRPLPHPQALALPPSSSPGSSVLGTRGQPWSAWASAVKARARLCLSLRRELLGRSFFFIDYFSVGLIRFGFGRFVLLEELLRSRHRERPWGS